MDRSAGHLATKHTDSSEQEHVGFFEQLAQFFRRNLNYLLAAGLILLLLQDIFGTHGILAMRRSEQEVGRVQNQINRINGENRLLQDKVNALKFDPEAIERIAREEMGLARPGEYIFKVQPKPDSESAPPNRVETDQKP